MTYQYGFGPEGDDVVLGGYGVLPSVLPPSGGGGTTPPSAPPSGGATVLMPNVNVLALQRILRNAGFHRVSVSGYWDQATEDSFGIWMQRAGGYGPAVALDSFVLWRNDWLSRRRPSMAAGAGAAVGGW